MMLLHREIFDLCYYGNGFIYSDIYSMPIYIRKYYYQLLVDTKTKEKEDAEANKPSVKKPKYRK
jgi:hypothetical protein